MTLEPLRPTLRRATLLAATAAVLAVAMPVQAHRAWLLPSATVLSGTDAWVSVDAAVSNDLFYFEHQPMRLDRLVVTAPDGRVVAPENASTGRYRSTFDVRLATPGTWRLAVVDDSLVASWRVGGGELQRARGTAEALAQQIPPQATEVSVTRLAIRNEVFVTAGKPSRELFVATGRGLEMLPVTHPNDLNVAAPAVFRFLLDGQPAAGAEVAVIPGGIRYRDQLQEQHLVADARGEVRITWRQPGMHWLSASPARAADEKPAAAAASRPAGGTLANPLRRTGYATTLEVLPQ